MVGLISNISYHGICRAINAVRAEPNLLSVEFIFEGFNFALLSS